MSRIVSKIVNAAFKVAVKLATGLSQDENDGADIDASVTEGMPELLREAAAEGSVLLKNDGTLPFAEGTRVSVFGRVQYDYFYTGYGSGGDIRNPYEVCLTDGIAANGKMKLNAELAQIYKQWREKNPADHGFWGHWPRSHPEMPVSLEDAKREAARSDAAVVVIGRSSGEDRENALKRGSYYLTKREIALLDAVTSAFDKVAVLLNVGSLIDMQQIVGYGDKIGAVMLVWQGGMESGNAAADLLAGDVNPSGCLADTVARRYPDYPSSKNFGGKKYNEYAEDVYVGYRYFETFRPDAALFPFGFGLSYTTFKIVCGEIKRAGSGLTIACSVENTGKRAGKRVVQAYVEKPCGRLGNPSRELAAFAKTPLLPPGGSCVLELKIPAERFASYDAAGATGFRSAYVIEEGEYGVYLGENVRDAAKVLTFDVKRTELFRQLSEVSAPRYSFEVLSAREKDGGRVPGHLPVPAKTTDLKRIILENLPAAVEPTGDKGYKLSDVRSGAVTMQEFVAQLSEDELEAISRGAYIMNSPLGPTGNAGVLGGVTESLRAKGIPPVTTTDGPSGIRLRASCSLIPIGTALACSFDVELIERLYAAVGAEMRVKGSDVLLAPGMNIHRNPLCGRNFEYFSEDPLLTGKMGAAVVKGLQSAGVSACPKHYACNNQEKRRNRNDSRLSERALREIYLKGFEICLTEAAPGTIMTSYNKINGVWGHYNYELCTSVLRGEWGFKGLVMTDWWMQPSRSREFPELRDNAYRVRAQVDVLMPGGKRLGKQRPDGTLLATLGRRDGITLGELQRTAVNVLNFAIGSSAMPDPANSTQK